DFSYEVFKAGWARVTFRLDNDIFVAEISYLHDSLRNLAQAALNLAEGVSEQRVVFMDEPGEHQLRFKRISDESYEVQLLWFVDWESWGIHSPNDFELIFRTKTSPDAFAKKVHDEMSGILNALGMDTYKKRWHEHDFPVDLLNALNLLFRR
ncbi:MAG: hypothetical protein AAGH92_09390, partial [Planctomycetota bacterium]